MEYKFLPCFDLDISFNLTLDFDRVLLLAVVPPPLADSHPSPPRRADPRHFSAPAAAVAPRLQLIRLDRYIDRLIDR